ncbi:uncharacterized protein isoform X1 [Salmo salar]|uniref:Uncharacterized protein isoform X1 n=1 Tax=Salmo salar TaxID=8030 RepID=A0ABM3E8A5_SALSA|nr:uncharacterized protein LOC106593218 isoform X1 [Salmo salar]
MMVRDTLAATTVEPSQNHTAPTQNQDGTQQLPGKTLEHVEQQNRVQEQQNQVLELENLELLGQENELLEQQNLEQQNQVLELENLELLGQENELLEQQNLEQQIQLLELENTVQTSTDNLTRPPDKTSSGGPLHLWWPQQSSFRTARPSIPLPWPSPRPCLLPIPLPCLRPPLHLPDPIPDYWTTHLRPFFSQQEYVLVRHTHRQLVHSGYYWGPMEMEEAHRTLLHTPPGSFLIRYTPHTSTHTAWELPHQVYTTHFYTHRLGTSSSGIHHTILHIPPGSFLIRYTPHYSTHTAWELPHQVYTTPFYTHHPGASSSGKHHTILHTPPGSFLIRYTPHTHIVPRKETNKHTPPPCCSVLCNVVLSCGCVVARDSSQPDVFFTLSYHGDQGPISVRVLLTSQRFRLNGSNKAFDSLFALLQFYMESSHRRLRRAWRRERPMTLQQLCRGRIIELYGAERIDSLPELNQVVTQYLQDYPYSI